MLFHKHIQELLFHYDCVIIPNFGGFICSFTPAQIHPVQHRFHPPGKKISFNKMLIMNDGLLAHHIALTENISYGEALVTIEENVLKWKDELRNGSPLELTGIGRFFNDSSGNLQFQYETDLNFLSDSYGLTPFQSLPIDRSEGLKLVHKAKEENVKENLALPAINKLAKYSVAAALISVAVLTAYKIQLWPDVQLNKISLNPFKSEKPVYESIKYSEFESNNEKADLLKEKVERSNETWMEYDVNAEGVPKKLIIKLKDPIVEKEEIATINSYGKFHVVGGCFSVESNAKKMVRKLKKLGFEADMNTMHKGLHVVSYQSFSNQNEARAMLSRVKDEHNNQAWLLIK